MRRRMRDDSSATFALLWMPASWSWRRLLLLPPAGLLAAIIIVVQAGGVMAVVARSSLRGGGAGADRMIGWIADG